MFKANQLNPLKDSPGTVSIETDIIKVILFQSNTVYACFMTYANENLQNDKKL